jgi:AraC-like DNA-binding protein
MKPDLWTSNTESAWRRKIGMSTKDDQRAPHERNVFLRRLKGLVEQRMLEFLQDEKPDAQTLAERTPTWTPIPWICHNLEISHAHLSRLFRELMGLNVIQYYDTLKLLESKTILKYIALIREFVAAFRGTGVPPVNLEPESMGEDAHATYSGNGSAHFWKWLKAQRKNPDFDRQAIAREFNFPSAARFHRAYFYATHSTPREFENLIIRLAIDDPKALQETIDLYTPKAPTLEELGITQLHHEQLISRDSEAEAESTPPPQDLEFPIVLYKPPAKPTPADVIDAVFTVLNRQPKRPRKNPDTETDIKEDPA